MWCAASELEHYGLERDITQKAYVQTHISSPSSSGSALFWTIFVPLQNISCSFQLTFLTVIIVNLFSALSGPVH